MQMQQILQSNASLNNNVCTLSYINNIIIPKKLKIDNNPKIDNKNNEIINLQQQNLINN
jgi:hypothetical protein